MTGKYPERIPITDWIPGVDPKSRKLLDPADKHELPLEEMTIGERLKGEGYAPGDQVRQRGVVIGNWSGFMRKSIRNYIIYQMIPVNKLICMIQYP